MKDPPTVVIPAGQTSAQFDLTVVDDVLLDGSLKIRVTASGPGHSSGTGLVQVIDNETTALSLTLPKTANKGEGTVFVRFR